MKELFGKRLKKLREENNETQKDIAEEFKVDKSMICLWEKGKNYPKVEKLIEIAEYYKVSTDYLLGLENKGKKEKYINNSFNNFNNTGNIKI